jgi:hypothetical protein
MIRLQAGRPRNRRSIPDRGQILFPETFKTAAGPTQPTISRPSGAVVRMRGDKPPVRTQAFVVCTRMTTPGAWSVERFNL